MSEKIKLLGIGAIVTLITFLMGQYFDRFMTREVYASDKLENVKIITIIQADLKVLKTGQDEIKTLIRK